MTAEPPYILLRMDGRDCVMRGTASWASTPDPGKDGSAVWAKWHWDGQALTAATDRHGFHALFVYEKDGAVALSPSLVQLAAIGCDPALDEAALAVFHRIGFFIDDETPLRHVRTLPPGGALRWEMGRLTLRDRPVAPRAQAISRKDAVDGLIAHFAASVGRILESAPDPLHLPLTGGRDSRHILLEMLRQGRRPDKCVTVHHNGREMPPEALAARAICERRGVAHDVLGYTRPRIADTVRTLRLTSLCADEHAQMLPLYDYFLTRPGAVVDGVAGNTLTEADSDAAETSRMAEAGRYEAIAQRLIDGHSAVISHNHWRRGAGPLFSPEMDDMARTRIAAAIERHSGAPNPVQLFRYLNRMRREISLVPQAILSSAERVYSAYLDTDLVDFCLSLPLCVTQDMQLHNDAIATAFPEDADVPFLEGFKAPPSRRGSLVHKLGSLRDVMRITRALAPDNAMAHARTLIAPPADLLKGPGYTYRLHAMCLNGLDAAKARRLLALSDRLERDKPRRLISDRYEGTPP